MQGAKFEAIQIFPQKKKMVFKRNTILNEKTDTCMYT